MDESRGIGRGQGRGAGRGQGRGRRGDGPWSGEARAREAFRRGGGRGRRGGWQQADVPSAADAPDWFTGRLPEQWFSEVSIEVDREEITVIGTLRGADGDSAESADSTAGHEGRIARFRAETKEQRIAIAQEAEAKYGRKVAWGATIDDTTVLFSHLAVPVMTRLKQPERKILDTLVDAGVARSRSDALAWCVGLVGDHADKWLAELREAMSAVDKVRGDGPDLS